MLEIKVEGGHVCQRAEGNVQQLASDVLCAIASVHGSVRDRSPFLAALFRAIVAAGVADDSLAWNDRCEPGGVHIGLAPGADEVIKRVVEGGRQHDGD